MLMNVVLAVALGLAGGKADEQIQVIQYKASDYAGLVGRFSQSVDKRGTTHLRGFDRMTGAPFDVAIDKNGAVEATIGDKYVTFTVSEAS